MKRPAFQFYPDNWRNNAKLRRCSWAARGVWLEVMCLMHDSDRYGVLDWPLSEIAQALGCPLKLLRELVEKGVLKGSDSDEISAFIYVPRSGRKSGPAVTLIEAQSGPIWFSSRMVEDEHKRFVRGESEAPKPAPKDSPNPPKGADIGPYAHGRSSPSPSPTALDKDKDIGASPPSPQPSRLNGHGAEPLPGFETEESPPDLPDCPHSKLIELYAKRLPHLVKPRVWEGQRQKAMAARWRQCSQPTEFGDGYSTTEQGIEFWDRFFAFVAHETRIAHGFERQGGGRWEPDLPWLMKAENFAKIIEGKYAK